MTGHNETGGTKAGFVPASFTLGPLVAGPPCCTPDPQIRVEKLSIEYSGNAALKDVSLELYRGCITALIGPSGCGKTSFLSSLNRLTDMIPSCSVRGQIMIDGLNLRDPKVDVRALRRRVGMIFQRPNPFPLSIHRNLEMPLREHGIKARSERDARIEKALTDVGLWSEIRDRLDSPALALSGGQQQRLCIARALVLEPDILLMDEPCSALDPLSSGVVEDLIQNLRGRFTVVIVTHNLAQARRIANYAAFFWVKDRAGTLVEFGKRCVAPTLTDQAGIFAWAQGIRSSMRD
jgi:phosphate transport system ATP-binding protein